MPNPYRPGFNQPPLVLAGRSRVLDAIDESLAVAALDGRTPRPVVLTGGRGVGKTVILGEAGARAADGYSWLTAPVEDAEAQRIVFDTDFDARIEKAAASLGIDFALISAQPGHA